MHRLVRAASNQEQDNATTGLRFEQALTKIKAGKRVRRPTDPEQQYTVFEGHIMYRRQLSKNSVIDNRMGTMDVDDLMADDWEVVKEVF